MSFRARPRLTGMKTIVVTGVTGSQGSATARALVQAGARVRGLTRNPESPKAKMLAAKGVELVRGDLDDAASIGAALEGADGVYAVTDFFTNGIPGEIAHGKRIADLAKARGVGHLVFASVASAERAPSVPHFASKVEIERHIHAIGQPATILAPTIFMEDLTEKQYVPSANWGMFRKIVGADRPILWISVDDIGAIAAKVLLDPKRFIGQRLPLAGDRLSIAEARRVFEKVDGKRPFAFSMPTWIFSRLVSDDLVQMWKWLASNEFDADVEATRRLLPELRDMKAWLEEKRAVTRRTAV
jgi:uncharacterized protein YbjT (DUF2867 family)